MGMNASRSFRRSSDAQLTAMRRQWPDFDGRRMGNGTLVWRGPLKPKAQLYRIAIIWHPVNMILPHVVVIDPPLRPRPGGTYAEIPHLIFYPEKPEFSGLCLFDPEGREWTPADLIADTTVPWTAEWLVYYELWHMMGEWLAPSVGYESVAHKMMDDAAAVRDALNDVH